MSKSKEILENFQTNILFTLAASILNFVINSYFLKKMGVDLLGLSKLFTQFVAYLSLADLGLGTASSYALYKPLAEKNMEQLNIVFSTIESFYKKVSAAILVIGTLFIPLLPYIVKNEKFGPWLYFYWLLYIINTSLSYVSAKYNILFLANQEYKYSRFVTGSTTILSQLIQLSVILFTGSFTLFIMAMIGSGFVNLYLMRKHYMKNYAYIQKTKERDKEIGKDMGKLFFHKVGSLIVFNTSYVILSIFQSLKVVGIYSSYLVIYNAMLVITNMIINVITPQIGKYIAEKSKEEVYDLWKEFYAFFVFLGIVLVFTTERTLNSFVTLWLGKDYLLPQGTVVLIMFNLFVNIVRGVTEAFKNGSGYFSDIQIPFIEGFINLGVSLALVRPLGLNGVILGSVASNLFIAIAVRPIMVFKRCFEKNTWEYLRVFLKFTLLVAASVGISWGILTLFLHSYAVTGWKRWIISAAANFSVVLAVSFAMFMTDRSFRKNISRFDFITNRIRRRKL